MEQMRVEAERNKQDLVQNNNGKLILKELVIGHLRDENAMKDDLINKIVKETDDKDKGYQQEKRDIEAANQSELNSLKILLGARENKIKELEESLQELHGFRV
jgi:hypothetical protein